MKRLLLTICILTSFLSYSCDVFFSIPSQWTGEWTITFTPTGSVSSNSYYPLGDEPSFYHVPEPFTAHMTVLCIPDREAPFEYRNAVYISDFILDTHPEYTWFRLSDSADDGGATTTGIHFEICAYTNGEITTPSDVYSIRLGVDSFPTEPTNHNYAQEFELRCYNQEQASSFSDLYKVEGTCTLVRTPN